MYILRLRPQRMTVTIDRPLEKVLRRKKRIKALDSALPEGKRVVYYAKPFFKYALDFAKALGNVEVFPIEEMEFNKDENLRILIDYPEKMEVDLWEKVQLRQKFDRSLGVLTRLEEDGSEYFIWAHRPKDWIYFVYPEEILVPARIGMGVSLQGLLMPKIEEGAKDILEMRQWFVKEPREVESVHQYRVSIRSFRTLISLVKPLLNSQTYNSLQNQFRAKLHDAERLRELDVLIEKWNQIRSEEDVVLYEALVKERQEEAEKLLGIVNTTANEQELRAGFNNFIHVMSMTNWHEIDGVYFLDQRLHGWYGSTLEALWDMREADLNSIHKVRLKSKKYRYVSKFFKDYVTETQNKNYSLAKDRQSELGEVCDALRNQEAVEEILPKLGDGSLEEARTFINMEREREDYLLDKLNLKPLDNSEKSSYEDNPSNMTFKPELNLVNSIEEEAEDVIIHEPKKALKPKVMNIKHKKSKTNTHHKKDKVQKINKSNKDSNTEVVGFVNKDIKSFNPLWIAVGILSLIIIYLLVK